MNVSIAHSKKHFLGLFLPLTFRAFSCTSNLACTKVVRKEKELRYRDLVDLFTDKILALCIPGYTEKKICSKISSKLLRFDIKDYSNAPGIGRIGMAYYEVMNPEEKKRYYEQANKNINELRGQCFPYLSPIDKFRLELQELWPSGAHIQNLGHGNMFVGLSRAIEKDKDILPHEDVLKRDDNSSEECRNIISQIAMNVYLQMPKIGGELELWNQECSDEEFEKLREGSYGILRTKLPAPSVRIKPETGELILFKSSRLHAVLPVKGDKRLSISCFLAFRGLNKPLTVWS